jgi:acyl dehydratase
MPPDAALQAAFAPYVGQPFGPPEVGRDPVNEPMIRQWCEAMGDRNPVYQDAAAAARSSHAGIVAPPTMLQAWILPGFRMSDANREPADRQEALHALFQAHGYTGVVATDCELEFTRYLRPGETSSRRR